MPKHRNLHKVTHPEPTTPTTQSPDPYRLIRLPEVLQLISVARSTWWLWVKQGKAPPAIRLGRCTFWNYAAVIAMTQPQEISD